MQPLDRDMPTPMTNTETPPPLVRDLTSTAIFLDFDGTLAEFADHPEAVEVPQHLIARLEALHRETGGAVAVITGRDIGEIDTFLAPLRLPIAGIHGLVRRTPAGETITSDVDDDALDRIEAQARAVADDNPGVIVERKTAAVALHYRTRPDAGPACDRVMADAVADADGFKLQRGKLVVEARRDGQDKGAAIAAFLAEPPFEGRRPVFAGDDITDEDGFAVLNDVGGITVKVGAGESAALYRVPDVAALRAWLDTLGAHADAERAAQ